MANNTGKKHGGREAGTPNNLTKKLREKFILLVENNIEKLQNDIDNLEPKDRLKIIIEISKFVIPTLKSTEINDISNDKFSPIILNINE